MAAWRYSFRCAVCALRSNRIGDVVTAFRKRHFDSRQDQAEPIAPETCLLSPAERFGDRPWEVGRVERTLFMIEWILDTDMQRRAQIDLNKGEAHHALKNALRIGRQGEIRDRTTEGQHYRIAGLNLLTAIIIYWNTVHLGHAIGERRNEGLDVPPELLAHISPLGWAHILLTGEYLWPTEKNA